VSWDFACYHVRNLHFTVSVSIYCHQKEINQPYFREEWSLGNEELYNLYSSPNKIRMMKSGRVRLAGHVARMGAKRSA
jgi:hypothetical protein